MNRLLQIHCAFLFAVLGSGCVNTQLAGDVDPSIDINAYETFYVVHNPDDKRELEKVIAAEITAIGKTATFGTESTAPDGTEVVVTYNSKWMWDITMEYVDGEPLDTYSDRRNLDVDARLDLFQQIGNAVQYAHRNLIVHRDLKPANVLVEKNGNVKLLDFGIAKALTADGHHVATRTGVMNQRSYE